MTMAKTDWRDQAACLDEDPELFFPVSEVGPGAEQVRRAKSVCARCPVRAECLNYAVENGLGFGVFGGTTAQERRRPAGSRPEPAASRPEAAQEPDGFAEAS